MPCPFDLDNTLVDLDEAFQAWAEEFATHHRLDSEAVNWLIALDRVGRPHRTGFFTLVREHFAHSTSVGEPLSNDPDPMADRHFPQDR